jgi:error-prone DNA polymerase
LIERDDYVELHAASAFSFLSAASHPEGLVEQAAGLGMDAMAITDRNGVYGAARFHTTAKRFGVRAHIGAEIAVCDWSTSKSGDPSRIVLLCASQVGYQNLCQLITRFKMREATKAEGAATLDDLGEFAQGLICLTGGEDGPLAAGLAHDGMQVA